MHHECFDTIGCALTGIQYVKSAEEILNWVHSWGINIPLYEE